MMDAMRASTTFAYTERVERIGLDAGDTLVIEPMEQPLLAVDTTIRQASRGRGQVVGVAAAADHVLVATSRGFVLQYSWDDYGNEKITEVEILKAGPDSRVVGLSTDPSGMHCIVSARVQVMDAVKPLVHSIAESGLFLDAFHRTISWGGTEALALGAAFSGHALKHLHLRVTGHYIRMEGGFMPALATALPTLESLSLSRALVHNTTWLELDRFVRLKAEQLGRVWPVGGGISPPAFQLRLDHHEHRRYHAALNAISPYVEVKENEVFGASYSAD